MKRSGAGKTTLLSILCGRNSNFSGEFRINGREVGASSMRYVPPIGLIGERSVDLSDNTTCFMSSLPFRNTCTIKPSFG